MIIHFHISYKTMFGEQIVVNIQKDNEEVKFPLTTLDGERWSYDWCVEPTQQSVLQQGASTRLDARIRHKNHVPASHQFLESIICISLKSIHQHHDIHSKENIQEYIGNIRAQGPVVLEPYSSLFYSHLRHLPYLLRRQLERDGKGTDAASRRQRTARG